MAKKETPVEIEETENLTSGNDMEPVQETAQGTVNTEPEMVPVYFPPVRSKDEENFKLVILNGKRYQIKKGEQVMVPPEVAEVIRNAEREEQRFAERMLDRESKLERLM